VNLEQPIVVYDRACPLCRNLAALAQRRETAKLRFVGWQDLTQEFSPAELSRFKPSPQDFPNSLAVITKNGQTLIDAEAWQFLLIEAPGLKSLNWIASKLGLTKPMARALHRGGGFLRSLCTRC